MRQSIFECFNFQFGSNFLSFTDRAKLFFGKYLKDILTENLFQRPRLSFIDSGVGFTDQELVISLKEKFTIKETLDKSFFLEEIISEWIYHSKYNESAFLLKGKSPSSIFILNKFRLQDSNHFLVDVRPFKVDGLAKENLCTKGTRIYIENFKGFLARFNLPKDFPKN